VQDLLDVAKRAARTASDLLRDAHAEDIRSKSNAFDLVTEWDLRSEDAIRGVLRETGFPILGEEGGQDSATGEMRWLVDPIDGTVNFSHGLPIWSISIALEKIGGDVQVAVVTAPALGWHFEAVRGHGAFDDKGAPLHVSTRTPLSRAMLATGFPYDASRTRAGASAARRSIFAWSPAAGTTVTGSAAYPRGISQRGP